MPFFDIHNFSFHVFVFTFHAFTFHNFVFDFHFFPSICAGKEVTMPKKKYAHDVPTKIPQSWIDDDDGTKVN